MNSREIRAVGVGGTSASSRKPDRARSAAVEAGKPPTAADVMAAINEALIKIHAEAPGA